LTKVDILPSCTTLLPLFPRWDHLVDLEFSLRDCQVWAVRFLLVQLKKLEQLDVTIEPTTGGVVSFSPFQSETSQEISCLTVFSLSVWDDATVDLSPVLAALTFPALSELQMTAHPRGTALLPALNTLLNQCPALHTLRSEGADFRPSRGDWTVCGLTHFSCGCLTAQDAAAFLESSPQLVACKVSDAESAQALLLALSRVEHYALQSLDCNGNGIATDVIRAMLKCTPDLRSLRHAGFKSWDNVMYEDFRAECSVRNPPVSLLKTLQWW
jgi:hypothetical protein